MIHRRLGRTGLSVSAVGFGCCQLRSVPEKQAVATLRRGFELGVNIVHAAPDYEGADDLAAEAIAASRKQVYVCSNGYGSDDHFEHLFETTRAKFKKKRLELFGIASVEDREILGENVWGAGGMIEFLAAKKAQGTLGHTFCTSHGSPEFIARLITCGAFDAVMFAYNPLGYHLLSFHPPDDRAKEDVARNRELISLAAANDVGVMLMEVLGGGLLCEGKAFPRRHKIGGGDGAAPPLPTARQVIRHLLRNEPQVACVMPGTASVEEAEENAMAGHEPLEQDDVQDRGRIGAAVTHMQATICSRCGKCEELCSQHLPVSWLFRSAYIDNGGAVPFETPIDRQYFDMHAPGGQSTCATCPDQSCACPAGIDIPARLSEMHEIMNAMLARGQAPGPAPAVNPSAGQAYAARLLFGAWDGKAAKVSVVNTGTNGWHLADGHPRVRLVVRTGWKTRARVRLCADVPAGERGHFSFHLPDSVGRGAELWLEFRKGFRTSVARVCLGNLALHGN